MAIAAEYFTLAIAPTAVEESNDAARFTPMGGLQITSLNLQATPLDSLDFRSNWRRLGARSAAVRMRIAGSGIFAAAAADKFLAHLFLTNQQALCRLNMPGFGRFTGAFMIAELAYEARHEEEVSWRIGLQSAAAIRFDASE